MIIEIRGTGFSNKGAELMLAAIVERLGATVPDVRFVVDTNIGPYHRRASYGLLQKFDVRRAGRAGWLIERIMHRGYRSRFGLVAEEDIDVLLDASGFALGDQWKESWVGQAANHFERMKKSGKKVILLPQALGPFQKSGIRDASRRALAAADLVFARESESFAHASALVPDHKGLHQYPDFTNLLSPMPPRCAIPGPRPACIVPNKQMIAHGSEAMKAQYVPFMAQCANHLRQLGCTPFILVHEDKADDELARTLAGSIGGEVPILTEPDARVLKGIIAESHVMVGSRFHGLVSALSQGIPAFGTSWSHKYRLLYDDYQRPDWLLDPTAPIAPALSMIAEVIQQGDEARDQLIARSKVLKRGSEEMWELVEGLLKK